VLKARRNKVVSGTEGMIGEFGVARTDLAPEGKVFVHGELWNAVASENVKSGERVVVNKVSGLQVDVSPAPEKKPIRTA
jgi:membrane-bound serine protease (ClpP class)